MPLSAPLARALAAGAFLCIAGPALAQAPFEGVISMKVRGNEAAEPMPVKAMIRSGVTRVETATPMGQMAMVADVAKGRAIMIMDDQQAYMEQALPNPAQAAERMKAAGREPVVTKTDRKETIAGHSCDHYTVKVDTVSFDACLASGIAAFPSMQGGMGGRRGGGTGWLAAVGDGTMFPLRITRVGSATALVEVTSIEKKKLDAGLFSVPAGYQKRERPQGQGGGRP
jgi:hypothetical protein